MGYIPKRRCWWSECKQRQNQEFACAIIGKILNTGVVEEILIECTETRDQPKNKERALSRLRTFIYDKEHQKYIDDIASKRKTMVSTGDRSAKSAHTIIHKDV